VAFLAANAGDAEVAAIARMQGHDVDPEAPLPLTVALPAFTLTELAEAFQIGFLLFLPFLVLDLLVGSVLLSLGMHMLSPTTVSLPFKLLLFVLVEGWLILGEALVVGYTYPWAGG
jgi:type III secretion protein R